MSDLRKIIIDGKELEVDPAMTLIQACEQAGIEIPRFCYHGWRCQFWGSWSQPNSWGRWRCSGVTC